MKTWWTCQQLRMGGAEKRKAVIEQLIHTGGDEAVEPLLFALKDKDPEIRCRCARALMRYRDSRAVGPLIEMLCDTEPPARAAAAETLGHLGDPGAISPLVGFLRDPDPVVRTLAARSLGRLGWRPATDTQRVMFILALGNLKDLTALGPEGVGPLLDQLQNGSPGKQLAAIKALAGINDPRVRPALVAALRNNSSAVRIAALVAVARLADETAYPEIEKLLTDDHSAVRVVAVEAAAACGGARAVEPLIPRLKDESWEVRLEAALALGELGSPAAVDGLCELVGDPDRDVREKAVEALGRIRDARAIASLVPALVDVEAAVRIAAGSALRKLDRNWAVRPEVNEEISHISKALKHSDYWVRHHAGQLLEQLHISPQPGPAREPVRAADEPAEAAQPHPAVPVLTDMLFDRDRDLRLAAAVMLGRLADQTTGAILGAALRDDDPAVRQAAQQAFDIVSKAASN